MTDQDAIARARGLLRTVGHLESRGWDVTSQLRTWIVSRAVSEDLGAAEHEAESLADFDSKVRVSVDFGGAGVTYKLRSRQRLLIETWPAEFTDQFDPEHSNAARSIAAGALTELEAVGTFSARVECEVPAVVSEANSVDRVRTSKSVEVFTEGLSATPFWTWGPIFSTEGTTSVVVLEPPSDAMTGPRLTIAGPDHDWSAQAGSVRSSSVGPSAEHLLENAPHVDALLLLAHPDDDPLSRTLRAAGAALGWAHFASRVRKSGDASELVFEYFGLQHAEWRIGAGGIDISRADYASLLSLLEWSLADTRASAIAVRQVLSISPVREPWSRANEVHRAAEPVLTGLKSRSIAEVLASIRGLRAHLQSLSLEVTSASNAIARSASERTVALMIGLAGAWTAQSLELIPPALAAALQATVGAGLLVLGIWSVVVEGPSLLSPLKAFESDLNSDQTDLPPSERARVVESQALRSARAVVRRTRWAIGVLYFTLGTASVGLALLTLAN